MGQNGQAGHDDVLLGMHFIDGSMDEAARAIKIKGGDPTAVTSAGFLDYIKYIPQDLAHMSYADYWRWWFTLERYKGDELGLSELDHQVDLCLARGIKVKVDLAYCTWYTVDKDWEQDTNLVIGPVDMDDWIHLCDLLGRHYHGRIVQWMLQGESNDLKNYWQNAPIQHVQEVFRTGYRAFKRVDPGVLISVSGASPSVSAQALDEWYGANLAACKGFYDATSMNYFADVEGADPYHGLDNYYQAIKKILDELGDTETEIDSGESSIQWALTSHDLTVPPPSDMSHFDPLTAPLSEMKQSWRMNESMGTFYNAGGTKFIWWGSEYAPASGWAWRWGFRKFEDWWGIWDEAHKIPGTRIVCRYDGNAKDPRPVDYTPAWVRPADPYHPVWQVYKFWAQAAPPASESIRLPMRVDGSESRILGMSTYLQALDRCVILLQNDHETPITVTLDTSKTKWSDGSGLEAHIRVEAIDYASGDKTMQWESRERLEVVNHAFTLQLPALAGFTTVVIQPFEPALDGEYLQQILPSQVPLGQPAPGTVVVRNSGKARWHAQAVGIGRYQRSQAKADPLTSWRLDQEVEPGAPGAFPIQFPAADQPGYTTHFYRLCDQDGFWFGPVFSVSAQVVDREAPRKLLAFRELGHVRLKWFPPADCGDVVSYELYRAPGFEQPFELVATTSAGTTTTIDVPPQVDRAFYYRVTAVKSSGVKSRPSNEDNAQALSAQRIWDAEITACTIPESIRVGHAITASVTVKNSGLKTWDLSTARLYLHTTQLWGIRDNTLPRIALGSRGVLAPGESVTLEVPFVAPRVGRFENHWVVCMDLAEKGTIFFGTPLLVETEVTES